MNNPNLISNAESLRATKAEILQRQIIELGSLTERSVRPAANDPLRIALKIVAQGDMDESRHMTPEVRQLVAELSGASRTNARYSLWIVALCCSISLVLVLCMLYAIFFVYTNHA